MSKNIEMFHFFCCMMNIKLESLLGHGHVRVATLPSLLAGPYQTGVRIAPNTKPNTVRPRLYHRHYKTDRSARQWPGSVMRALYY